MALGWKLYGDGKHLGPTDVVAPDERLSWGRTAGLGAQHVVAMFGATFVFPLIMGLNPQLAIMMSGIATICFLLIVKNKVPSYLGTSAAFVGGVVAIYAQHGTPMDVTGAILIAGVVLAGVGLIVHFVGAGLIHAVLPPVVTGAVVMLIGFNLAPVVATIYWPQDQWIGFIVMIAVIAMSVGLRGFIGRVSIFLGLILGYTLSWIFDKGFGPITSYDAATGHVTTHLRVNALVRVPPAHRPREPRRRLAPPVVQPGLRPARAAGRDRPGRREHRPRQGGRRDDQGRPRPLHGSRAVR